MRYLNPLLASLLFIAAISSDGFAQTNERPPSEGQFEPFHKHHDTHFGHDHFYPDRGSIIREVPKEAATVSYAGVSYKFSDGIWYEPRGPAFMVVAPPIGLIVHALPAFSTLLARDGQVLIYCNDAYYRPRPDVNGYEVMNDPSEPTSQIGSEQPATAATVPAAAPMAGTIAIGAEPAGSAVAAAQPIATPLAETAKVSVSSPQELPSPVASAVPSASVGLKVALNPKQGQSAEQQARDRYECYRFALAQSGFDPMRGSNSASQSDYERAQAACFDGRGYAVR